jgi:hypothetical protein
MSFDSLPPAVCVPRACACQARCRASASCQSNATLLITAALLCRNAVVPTGVHSQGLCLPGALSYIGCYIDRQGYLADVAYYASSAEEQLTLCGSSTQQLSQTQLTSIVRSVGEVFTSVQVCSDNAGVRGLIFSTSLSQTYSCGQTSGICSRVQGDAAPLAGFSAECGLAGALLRVQGISSPCWNRNYVQPASPGKQLLTNNVICGLSPVACSL